MFEMKESLKKCFKCENIQLIAKFNKEENRKKRLFPQCIKYRKDFYLKNFEKIKKYDEQNGEK